ncbi:hypothetical protein [Streptomyces sp. NPDC048111]|uniref:hypothetical protein n=1 Tax=Streptomyces sp. NPDC048111 TaxID=3365500 RepID=UPI0037158896
MPRPLIRFAIGRTNGTAHYGVLLADALPVTACGTHAPGLRPIGEHTAHTLCQSCTRAWLVLTTAPHPGGEPEFRPAAGAGKSASSHRPIPGHLLGFCGKPLDDRPSTPRRVCANCNTLDAALDRFHHTAGELTLPSEPCHIDDAVLWAPNGHGNLVTGHHRDATTGTGYCGQPLEHPHPGAQACAPCRRRWEETEVLRQIQTLPSSREVTAGWQDRARDTFSDVASTLEPGDAYTLSGCAQRHHVVEVLSHGTAGSIELLVYLPGEDRLSEVRLRRERLVTVERLDSAQQRRER